MNFVSDHMRVRWIWLLRSWELSPWVALVEKVPPLGSNASCDDPSSMASSGESREKFWISRVSLLLLRLKTVWSTSVIWNMSWVLVFISLQNISRTLSYMEQKNVMFGGSLQLPCNDTYIQHLESRLCRVDVAPLRPLRSNELFRHHTHLHRGVGKTAIINIAIRGVGYHKHCHQGSR